MFQRLLSSALLLAFVVAGCSAPQSGATGPLREGGEDELVKATQEMLDAVAPGDKKVWEHFLAQEAIYTDENGKTYTKKEFLDELKPLPPIAKGTLKIRKSAVRMSGDHAVIVHQDDENEEIYGQKITTGFVSTDTWRLLQGRWELLSVSVIGLHADPAVAKLAPARFDACAGEYSVAGAGTMTVRHEGDHLIVERDGRQLAAAYPEGDGIFFGRGSSDRWVFFFDDAGKATELRQRRRGNDIVWRRTK